MLAAEHRGVTLNLPPNGSGTGSSGNYTPRVRIRTLNVCEPSEPSREIVRHENFLRRQAQKNMGWLCPSGVVYRGIDPNDSTNPKKVRDRIVDRQDMENQQSINSKRIATTPTKESSRRRSSAITQEETLNKAQYELTIRRLQTAQQKQMKKSRDILKSVQLGHSITDVVNKFPIRNNNRADSVELMRSSSIRDTDDKDSDILYDMLIDDDDDDDGVSSSVATCSGIRDDIMSPRTVKSSLCSLETHRTNVNTTLLTANAEPPSLSPSKNRTE
ncbi:unnamed protein product [Didymodactylos carnosus]|uniref:Uncharacterized protein n=1 Tax=Didymodactylos carnosus TaxID=1234261 RepID=A0A814DY38_9BILA|nr:unnamed protein product [Didymodactylos carnosus]CAF0962008.1 unnamed protein product [Didymodactylos carnosus]CAF3598951.1 unnamed protein product [Didymodactylos carnosus]CAF3736449.1 unnamed protein product [Didymodactylos carnosus]